MGDIGRVPKYRHFPRKHTHKDGDVLFPLVEEIIDELAHTAESQVLEGVGGAVPQFHKVEAIFETRYLHDTWQVEPSKSSVHQFCWQEDAT